MSKKMAQKSLALLLLLASAAPPLRAEKDWRRPPPPDAVGATYSSTPQRTRHHHLQAKSKPTVKYVHLAAIFPISGKEGWQGGQVREAPKSCAC